MTAFGLNYKQALHQYNALIKPETPYYIITNCKSEYL